MTKRFLHGTLALLLCLGLAGVATAQNILSIGETDTVGLTPATMTVSMEADADVQGFVLAIGHYDNTMVNVTAADVTAAVAGIGAELVVSEFFADGFTLGVVLDAAAPFDGQIIPAGTADIATFDVEPLMYVDMPTPVTFEFVDGEYNDPVLNNILVQGGLSVGVAAGLDISDIGTLTLIDIPPATLYAPSLTYVADDPATTFEAPVLMDNVEAVQGFVLAMTYAGGTFNDISIAGTVTDAAGAEFVVPDTSFVDAVTLGVVLDFTAPFEGQTIPAGMAQPIANFIFDQECDDDPAFGYDIAFDFVDGVLGDPLLDNVVVIAGLSINPLLVPGVVSVVPTDLCGTPPPPGLGFFAFCGEGLPGDAVEICFGYTSGANVQGFQLAVCFDTWLTFNEDFSVDGTIVGETGAEFVNYDINNDAGEFIAGILLDALPPFDGQTVPPTAEPLLIGCLTATIEDGAPCDEYLSVDFCDGIMANGSVAIENIMVVDYQSIQDFDMLGCGVYVAPTPTFKRGDCNNDDKVDLADPATVLGEQFFGEPVDCEDACDANDDGKINLADSVFLLNYLFKGGAAPSAPGPADDGVDPTDDLLGCDTAAC